MARFKTFNSTGVAPDGRLYAGDLNAIQDMKADLSNFAQAVDVAQVRFGESGLQILRHGSLEARLTGAFRTDGIIRGLGGLVAPQFTTAQRDVIPAGYRPNGLIIHNTTTARLEMNVGTDVAPVWQSAGAGALPGEMVPGQGLVPAGAMFPYGGTVAPTGFLLADGSVVLRASYPTLFTAIGTSHNIGGEAADSFRLPNAKGRAIYGRDAAQAEFTTVGQVGGLKTIPLAAMPSHSHTVVAHSHTVNSHSHAIVAHNHAIPEHRHVVNSHSHTGVTHGANARHSHSAWTDAGNSLHSHPAAAGSNFGVGYAQNAGTGTARGSVLGGNTYTDNAGSHTHGVGIGNDGPDHGHGITAEAPGSGGPTDTSYNAVAQTTNNNSGALTTDPTSPGTTTAAPATDSQGSGAVTLPPYIVENVIIKT